MRGWGIWLVIFAVGSVLLPMAGLQFIILSWIDMWGATVGWVIRGVLLVAGLGLILAGSRKASTPAAGGASEQPRAG